MVRRLSNLFDGLLQGLAVFAAIILFGMALWITYDVLLRYFFSSPTIWADDLSEYGLLWATFLAAPWVLRKEGHVRIELITQNLTPKSRFAIGVVVSLVGAAVCAVFAWHTALTTFDFFSRNLIMARTWRIPVWLPYAAIPVGSGLMALEFLFQANRHLRGDRTLSAAGPGHI